jgi:hypothetical protein
MIKRRDFFPGKREEPSPSVNAASPSSSRHAELFKEAAAQ